MDVPENSVTCPSCRESNPAGSVYCCSCQKLLNTDQDETLLVDSPGDWSKVATGGAVPAGAALAVGSLLGNRYQILGQLGSGGMGTVYKVRDKELDRLVALKVIRPELASSRSVLQRFKQELILARQVTHKNVIRIFDLGDADGVKFITMEYIEGQALSSILEKRKLGEEEAIKVMRQVCRALEAAHAEGVVHRDLKPQNIMVNEQGKVWVMDFGLARSMEEHGLTQAGGLMGTPAYMSPEQAQGKHAGPESDLFALGIVFYEALTGVVPFRTETLMGSLLKRIQEDAEPIEKLEPSLRPELAATVMKCLVRDPLGRHQTVAALLQDLDVLSGESSVSVGPIPPVAPPILGVSRRYWAMGGAVAAGAVLVGGGNYIYRILRPAPAGPQKPLLVLVADFANETGEEVFDGALEANVAVGLEEASFITSFNRATARRIASQLKPGATRLDEQVARLVAVREGISVVVAGTLTRDGDRFLAAMKAADAVTGNAIRETKSKRLGKQEVLGSLAKLTHPIREALGDTTPESVRLAAAESYTAGSLEAAHSYAAAQELRFAGKAGEAIEKYLQVVRQDPNLASAYYGLAVAYSNLGQRQKAEEYYQQTMARIDRMSEREKYRARGGYYLAMLNHQKAMEQFTELVRLYPADFAGMSNLALVYYLKRDMSRALEHGRRALEIYPKNALLRSNAAMYAMYAGNFENSAKEAQAVIEANPAYLKAYNTLALSKLAQGQVENATATYQRLEKVDNRGASFAAMGLADIALYEGRAADAAAILQAGIKSDLANQFAAPAAKKRASLAQALLMLGRKGEAAAAAAEAAKVSKENVVQYQAARTFLEAGMEAKAQGVAEELGQRIETDPQAYGKLIEGEIRLAKGDLREARRLFEESRKLADTWLSRLNMGRAYLATSNFTEADSEFDACWKRRGEATEMFLDEVQTFRYVPLVHYYIGQARDGLKSAGAADSYRAFLGARQKAVNDPLASEVRRRLAALGGSAQ